MKAKHRIRNSFAITAIILYRYTLATNAFFVVSKFGEPNSYNKKDRHPSNNRIGFFVSSIDNTKRKPATRLYTQPSNDDDEINPTREQQKSIQQLITEDPKRSIIFSIMMSLCGASLGPFLDSYHSAFGVLQYYKPIRWILWGSSEYPALTTAWWVPELFGLAGFIIGWLYILLDGFFQTPYDQKSPSVPKILVGISIFTFQYWLSGILFQSSVIDRTTILNLMSVIAAIGFYFLDRTLAGWITSLATCLGGPLIEAVLITATVNGYLTGGYHYNDLGETQFFPLWIIPVYYLGGPANGNLARGFWNALTSESSTVSNNTSSNRNNKTSTSNATTPCQVCQDTRRAICPNCDGVGTYVAMGGRTIKCTSCNGRGFVMCRACFDRYDEDPYDIDSIRETLNRMPD